MTTTSTTRRKEKKRSVGCSITVEFLSSHSPEVHVPVNYVCTRRFIRVEQRIRLDDSQSWSEHAQTSHLERVFNLKNGVLCDFDDSAGAW